MCVYISVYIRVKFKILLNNIDVKTNVGPDILYVLKGRAKFAHVLY